MEITFGQYIDAINIINAYHKQLKIKNEIIYIDNLDISIRLRNRLHDYFYSIDKHKNFHEVTTDDILLIDMNKFAKFKNVGKRSFDQLQELIIKIKTNTL